VNQDFEQVPKFLKEKKKSLGFEDDVKDFK